MKELVPKEEVKTRIARRIAMEFASGERRWVINLGVGIPTLVANYITGDNVFIQAENGLLGVGPAATGDRVDPLLINAGRQPVTETPGCSYFDSAMSFGMIRGGHVDATVIGSFEVDEDANIANWIIPNGKMLGVGGAMDLVAGARRVIVAMQHTASDGSPKFVKKCTLPITGFHEADMLVSELAVFRFVDGRPVLVEIAPEVTPEQLTSLTGADFTTSPEIGPMPI